MLFGLDTGCEDKMKTAATGKCMRAEPISHGDGGWALARFATNRFRSRAALLQPAVPSVSAIGHSAQAAGKSFAAEVCRAQGSRTSWRVAALVCAAAVTACGGGGSDPVPTAAKLSGRVVDGYIRGATVFWDCNRNGRFDAGEVFTTSAAGGSYSIEAASNPACDLLAEVPWDAIDEDLPQQTVGIGYTMAAAPGRTDVVSPLTTMIYGLVRSGSSPDTASASARLRQELGLTSDPTSDYKATSSPSNQLLGSHARMATSLFQATSGSGTLADSANQTRDSLVAKLLVPGVGSALSIGVQPFLYSDNEVLRLWTAANAARNSANIVLRKGLAASTADNELLDQIAKGMTEAGAAEYGFLNFHKLESAQLRDWMFALMRSGVGASDPVLKRNIDAFRTARGAALADASAVFSRTIDSETAWFSVVTNDPGATADLILALADASLSTAIDVTSIRTYGIAGKINGAARAIIKTKHSAKRLNSILEKLQLSVAAIDCAKKTAEVLAKVDDSAPLLVAEATSSCISVVSGVVSDLRKVKRYGSVAKAIKAGSSLQVLTVDVIVDGQDADKAAALAKICLDLFDIFHDAASLLDDPVTATTLSAIDLATQPVRLYLAAGDFGRAINGAQEKLAAEATTLFESEAAKILKSYYANFLSAYWRYFQTVDSLRDPYVSYLTALPAGNGALRVNVNGKNLPLVSLRANLGDLACSEESGSSATFRAFSCQLATYATSLPFDISNAGQPIPGALRIVKISELQLPRVDAVSFVPATPKVGDALTFTLSGQNLLNSGIVLAPFAPCQSTATLSPSSATNTSLTYVCSVRVAADSVVAQFVLADTGLPVPGASATVTVCPANSIPAVGGGCTVQPTSGTYDLVTDFSLSANPSGTWQYGFQTASGLLVMSGVGQNCSDLGMDCWKMSPSSVDIPMVAINRSGATVVKRTVVVPSGVAVLHPGLSGERAVVTWTAPESASVAISAEFAIVDRSPSGVQVFVHQDGVILTSAIIDGTTPVKTVTLTRSVSAGQTLRFSVDANGNYGNDSVSLKVRITRTN